VELDDLDIAKLTGPTNQCLKEARGRCGHAVQKDAIAGADVTNGLVGRYVSGHEVPVENGLQCRGKNRTSNPVDS
jgi:hypothetical protein